MPVKLNTSNSAEKEPAPKDTADGTKWRDTADSARWIIGVIMGEAKDLKEAMKEIKKEYPKATLKGSVLNLPGIGRFDIMVGRKK